MATVPTAMTWYSLTRKSVAAKAGELAAMTHGACLFIFRYLSRCVAVEPVVGMRRGLELGVFGVALLAAERRVDFVMTDKTIRHVWEHS